MLVSSHYREKSIRAEKRIREAFEFKNETAPYIVYDPLFFVFGRNEEDIPEDYFGDDPLVMARDQMQKIVYHMDTLEDSFIPILYPFYGTGVLASAFGVDVVFQKKMDPAVGMPFITDIAQLKELKKPDPNKDGLMPKVLKCIRAMREYSDFPVTITDPQGPLTTALSIVGYENFIYWMHDYPDRIHEFMQLVTDSLIDWIKIQKQAAGHGLEDDAYVVGLRIPEGFGGVCFSDDDSVIFGADLYREFVVPYNSQVLKAFGGGVIHYCGCSNQHIDNYLNTEGLTAIHNFTLDNIDAAAKMRHALSEKKIMYYAADYAVKDEYIEEYFETMIKKLGPKGLVIASYVAPAVAMYKGEYIRTRRNGREVAQRVLKAIQRANRLVR